jgi:hypothetical protein
MYTIKQSTAITIPFFVHDANGDAVTGLTDGSFTKRISKGSGAFGAMTVTITELENGWYSIPLTTTHSNTLGLLTIVFTNAGAKQVNLQFRVEAKLVDDLNDVAATDIVSAGAITTSSGAVSTVTSVTNAITLPTIPTNWLTADGLATDAAEEIADVVWDEDIIVAHTTTGSAGEVLASTRKLATGAGGISATYDSHTATDVGTETNTEANTVSLDGVYHICPPGVNLDMYYEFDVGVTGIATECIWDGYVTSNNDNCEVYGYDWVGAGWVQIGVIAGTSGTTDQESVFILDNTMTGAGANVGKVRVRFNSDGADLVTAVATNRILVEYTALPGVGVDLHDGTAQAATSNTITLDAGANATDDFYNHARIVITGGTGSEQERIIVDYAGSSKIAKVAPPWTITPDSTSTFIVEPGLGHSETDMNTLKVGLAAAATSTSITLDSDASAVDDYYNNDVVVIDAGTGEGQERVITDYNGTTKVATVDPAWTTTPDTTSEYVVEASHPYINSDLATIDSNVDAILVDTGTTLDTKINDIQGATFNTSTDSLEAIRDRGDSAWITGGAGSNPATLQTTTIATLSSQTSFTLTAGSSDDDAYNGMLAVITDAVTSEQKCVGVIDDYTGNTKTVTLKSDPGVFTIVATDNISIIAVPPIGITLNEWIALH